MKYVEQTVLFSCAGDTLLGILSRPETPAETSVIVITGGPQYRVGSQRQFLHLSRTLATVGYPVLRFDYRGMGDSEGHHRDFQLVSADIAAAISVMQQQVPIAKNVVLWGLCDGASAALLYCHEIQDPRVNGLCLLNPWIRSEASLARTHIKHYYAHRLMRQEFWLKLLTGKMTLGALSGLAKNICLSASASNRFGAESQPFQQRMAAAWACFPGQILLLLSSDDYVAKEFLEYANADPAWRRNLTHANLVRHDLPGVDHTCSSSASRALVEQLTLNWLAQPSALVKPAMMNFKRVAQHED